MTDAPSRPATRGGQERGRLRVVVTADDFGVSHGLNEAVARLHRAGRIRRTAVRIDGLALDHGLALLRDLPELDLSLHLNLTEGRPLSPPERVPLLIDDEGRYRRSVAGYLRDLAQPASTARRQLLHQIDRELQTQADRAADLGLGVQGVDGNQHVHLVPGIFERTAALAARHGWPRIRIPHEPLHASLDPRDLVHAAHHLGPVKHLLLRHLARRARPVARRHGRRWEDAFVGVLFTGRMSPRLLDGALRRLERRGVETVEALFHPADIDDPRDAPLRAKVCPYYFHRDRRRERDRLAARD
ncbi:MAG: ChbG/HpnK family deacetylase [Acidobacteriota bacterium]